MQAWQHGSRPTERSALHRSDRQRDGFEYGCFRASPRGLRALAGTSMIRHILLFEPRKDVAPEKVEELLTGLREFPKRFPEIRRFYLGRNISRRDTTFSYAMSMEFESIKDLEGYLGSEYHDHF